MIFFDDCPLWVPGTPETPEMRRLDAEYRFECAARRFFALESNRDLMREMAPRD